MADTNVNGQLSQEEQCPQSTASTVNSDITKAFDGNKNAEPMLKNVQTLENCKDKEANNGLSKIDNLSPELRDDSKFDAKEAEKKEICESTAPADSLSNGGNVESSVLNPTKEETGTEVQTITSADEKQESFAKESCEHETGASSIHCEEEQGEEMELRVEQTQDCKESNISCKTAQKEEQASCQTMAVAENKQTEEVTEEITNKMEEQRAMNTPSTEASPMEIEHTESSSLEAESTAKTQLENTAAAVEKKNEDVQATEDSSRFEPSQTLQQEASSSVWYTDEAEKEDACPKPEGYSTTVVGGVIVRKPLPSSSSPERRRSSPKSNGSPKLRMSLKSIFGKRKSSKSDLKPTETEEQNGNDMVIKEGDPSKGSTEEVDGLDSMKQKNTGLEVFTEEGSAKTAENNVQTSEALQAKSDDEEQNTQKGEIVPIEQGVSEADVDKQENIEKSEESHQDEDQVLRERILMRQSSSPSLNPEKHMQMRFSYAGGSNAGEKEVEVIGTREITKRSPSKSNLPANCHYSCRELGDVDHEGWLSKKGGGAFFSSWKRKWVVLKERYLYYYKTSFDIEAGGVVFLDENRSIKEAPELKRKHAFKVDCADPKAQKLFLAADTKEEMDKWLSVLSAARRGEVIARKTSQQVTDNVKMRKKTSSVSKRCGSVLGVGGLYEHNGNMEKSPPTLRPASFGSSPNEKQKSLSLSVLAHEYEEEEKKESDKPARVSDPPASVLQERETEVTDGAADEKDADISATIEATEVEGVHSAPLNASVASDADEEETTVAPVSLSVERPSSDESVPSEEEINIVPLGEAVKATEESCNQSKERTEEENPRENGTEQISQSKETVELLNQSEQIKQLKSQSEESPKEISQSEEKMPASHAEAEAVEEISQSDQRTEQTSQSENSTEASQSNEITKLVKSSSVSKSDRTSNTTWYLVLDVKNDVWVEYEFKPKNNDDELLSLVKTIKDARITITGTPLPGNEERGRAMTLVSPKNTEILRLNELKRSLKSKEKDLKAVDELLNQEIDRQSLHEWSTRYSYLTDDLSREPLADADIATDSDSSVRDDTAILKEENDEEDSSFVVKESESLKSNNIKMDSIQEENFEGESSKGCGANEEYRDDRKTCSEDSQMIDEKDKLSDIQQGEFAGTNVQNNEELTAESLKHDNDPEENDSSEENLDTKF